MNRRDSKSRLHGYTFVELMMSLAVFTIGVTGIIAMQKVTVSSNQHAKNLALATHIAEGWLDELAAESAQWNEAGDFEETIWLATAGAEDAPAGGWIRPAYNAGRNFGPAFDALGNPVATNDIARDAHFCSDLQLTWLFSQTGARQGGGLLRAQVRVYWRRHGIVGLEEAPDHVCDVSVEDFDAGAGERLYHVVYLSTAVRQHPMAE